MTKKIIFMGFPLWQSPLQDAAGQTVKSDRMIMRFPGTLTSQ